eukprot:6354139-Pyramimonas_sp.AAC.1
MIYSPPQQDEEAEISGLSGREVPFMRTVLWSVPPDEEEAANWAPCAAARFKEDIEQIRDKRADQRKLRGKGGARPQSG